MAVAQLVVVALSFLALSSGNKDTKTDSSSRRLFINTAAQNATGQQREGNEQKHTRFLRWALNSPTEELTSVPFSPETEHENQRSPWGHGIRRSAAMMLNAGPPLDKIDGRYVTRELVEPDFDGLDSFKAETVVNRKFALQPESVHSHRALKQFRTKRSDLKVISGLNDDVRLVKRLDDIDREWLSSGRNKKASFGSREKISGSGFVSWQKKNFDDSDQDGYNDLNKRNFDEINRAGFHSLGRRNFDETNKADFHSLGRRNFDEIDRAGFHILGRRNFDEIDRAGFHSLGRRNFDEIDRSGFHSLGRRNFDEIDKSAFRGFGKRDFDEIDRSGFRSFGKRDFDEIDRSGFRSFGKRDFDEIDRSGFRSFGKRDFDEIDRSGFRELGKRSLKRSASFGESSKDSYEAYKVKNDESGKRNFDKGDQAAFRNFSERSATEEMSKLSA